MPLKQQYVVIAGNLCTGKTTTVQMLGKELSNCVPFCEERSAYLERYYANPAQYAFRNQLSYSLHFLDQAIEIAHTGGIVAQDRSIYDSHYVFSRLRLDSKMISTEEYELLGRFYRAIDAIAQPTLLIMLTASIEIIAERIVSRGYKCEENIQLIHIQELEEAYKTWYDSFQLCDKATICTDSDSPQDVVRRIACLLT